MDHPLQMISYIADIERLVVLMVRRKPADHKTVASAACSSSPPKKCWMICHVFSSDDVSFHISVYIFHISGLLSLSENLSKFSLFRCSEVGIG